MTANERLTEISKCLEAIHSGWPFFLDLIRTREAELTESLINNDNEQHRGAIKELRRLADMPESLKQERDGISAELSERDSAD